MKLAEHALQRARALKASWSGLPFPEAPPQEDFIVKAGPTHAIQALAQGCVLLIADQRRLWTTIRQLVQQSRDGLLEAFIPGRFPQEFEHLGIVRALLAHQTRQGHKRIGLRAVARAGQQHTTANSGLIKEIDRMSIHNLALMTGGRGLIQWPDQRRCMAINGRPRAARWPGFPPINTRLVGNTPAAQGSDWLESELSQKR